MNRTREEWQKIKPSAVAEGSTAQATHVMKMMLQDIEALHRSLQATHVEVLALALKLGDYEDDDYEDAKEKIT